MYFQNLDVQKKILKSIDDNGLAVIKNFINNKKILDIKKKVKKRLNNISYLKTPSNIKAASTERKKLKTATWLPKKYLKYYKNNIFKQPTGEIENKVDNKLLKKGYKFYSNYTNSIEFKDPFINFPEIGEIVFNKKLFEIAKKFLKETPYLGYVALRCHFKNNLPNNDFNLYHTDGRTKITKKNYKLLKFLIPFHLEKKQLIEFSQILFKRNKMKTEDFYKFQYSKPNDLPKYLKKKIVKPKVMNGDGFFFDPDNFLHNAKKPNKLRIMLYIIFIKKKNYMIPKTKNILISKKFVNNLSPTIKKSTKFLNKV
jgi:hypothetical protein